MNQVSRQPVSQAAPFDLMALESLPCGCIAGVYWAHYDDIKLELVEAKGPHCVFFGHKAGKILDS